MTDRTPAWQHTDDAATDDAATDDAATDDAATDDVEDAANAGSSAGDGLEAAIATIEAAEGLLGDVEAALARLEAGQYRTCEICGAALDEAGLASTPTLRRCVAHAS